MQVLVLVRRRPVRRRLLAIVGAVPLPPMVLRVEGSCLRGRHQRGVFCSSLGKGNRRITSGKSHARGAGTSALYVHAGKAHICFLLDAGNKQNTPGTAFGLTFGTKEDALALKLKEAAEALRAAKSLTSPCECFWKEGQSVQATGVPCAPSRFRLPDGAREREKKERRGVSRGNCRGEDGKVRALAPGPGPACRLRHTAV